MSPADPTHTSPPDATRTSPPADGDRTRTRTAPSPAGTTTAPHAPADPAAPAVPGYEVLGLLGEGGMGVVWKARQSRLNRVVALKMVHGGRSAGSKDLVRFLAEAEAVAAVRHPHVVQVYEFGEADGRPFLAMEYLPGGSLADRLARGGRYDPTNAAALVGKLAEAVQAAHDLGIVHRDLKPANVLFDGDGEPKVADFGLAKRGGGSDLTKTQAVLGTPAYMAPEQALGKGKFAGPAADVWALGVVLYECLTGGRPFEAEDALALMRKVTDDDPVPPRERAAGVPRDLEAVCLKCLEKAPARRYATAEAVAEDLHRWLAGSPITARPLGPAGRLARWARRRPAAAALCAIAAAAIALAGGVAAREVMRRQADQAARRARAESIVPLLAVSDTRDVPGIISEYSRYPEVGPILADRAAAATDPREQLHLALARLPADPSLAGDVADRLLTADPAAVPVVVAALADAGAAPPEALWAAALGDDPGRSVRAAAALARLAPDDPRWAALAPAVAPRLARLDPLAQAAVVPVFRPVRGRLTPPLLAAYRAARHDLDQGELDVNDLAERAELAAASATELVILTADQPAELARVATEFEPRRHAVLFPLLSARRGEAAAAFRGVLGEPGADPPLAKRQAAAAAWLVRLGEAEAAWPLFRLDMATPDRRTYMVHAPAALGAGPAVLAERYLTEPDVPARRALALALGDFPPARLPGEVRGRLTDRLAADYRDHPNPGLHAAAGWVLRQWGLRDRVAPVDAAPRLPTPDRNWFVNGQGQTFAVVRGPVNFVMGAPAEEANAADAEYEAQHPVHIPRSFAIGLTEVTLGQFKRFVKYDKEVEKVVQVSAPTDDHPAVVVSWYLAAEYCNRLSKEEGIPEAQWCYLPNKDGKYGPGMRLKPDYLSLEGYRLPTEAEWEFACRAGTTTARHFGQSPELLDRYAVFARNSPRRETRPVGSLKPNDLGLFDVYGNALEWAADVVRNPVAGMAVTDVPADLEVVDKVGDKDQFRAARGAEYVSLASSLRSAFRNGFTPNTQTETTGFRLARTIRGKK